MINLIVFIYLVGLFIYLSRDFISFVMLITSFISNDVFRLSGGIK